MPRTVRESWHTARRIERVERRWRDLRDVRHPHAPDVRVERVLLRPTGIFVVTLLPAPSRRISGIGGVASRSGSLGVDAALVSAAQVAADVVAGALPSRYRGSVRPVLCRPLDDEPLAEMVDRVLVTTPATLEHVVRSSPVVRSTSELNEIGLRLDAQLEAFPVVAVAREGGRLPRWALLGLAAATSGAAALCLVGGTGGVPLPW